jgi:hypothetical protein
VFCGVGAAGGSWAQPVRVTVPNKIAVRNRMLEVKRANGIYSSPFLEKLGSFKSMQQKDLVVS